VCANLLQCHHLHPGKGWCQVAVGKALPLRTTLAPSMVHHISYAVLLRRRLLLTVLALLVSSYDGGLVSLEPTLPSQVLCIWWL